MHHTQSLKQLKRQAIQSAQNHMPHARKRTHIVIRTMRYTIAGKQLRQIAQFMRRKRGKRDTRKSKRVHPTRTYRTPLFCCLDKSLVKARVMRDDGCSVHKRSQSIDGHVRIGSSSYVSRVYMCKLLDFRWYGLVRVHKRCKPLRVSHILPFFKSHRRNLRKRTTFLRKTCCFGIKHNNIVLERTKVIRGRLIKKRSVTCKHLWRSIGNDVAFQFFV